MVELPVDQPDVLREITAAFHDYERAFMANDVDALIRYFWADARVTRYGIADLQLGHDAIAAFRRASAAPGFTRTLHNLRITTFGQDVATAMTEFRRSDTTLLGLQTQTWMRMAAGWRIVSAHVSMIEVPT